VHIFGVCGTRTVVQIGSCGGLQPGVHTGDIVLSEQATIGEGASQYYGGRKVAHANLGRVAPAAALLATTASTRTAAHRDDVGAAAAAGGAGAQVGRGGHLGVDMETSAVFSAATHFGMRRASLLFVWDELPFRSWATTSPSGARRAGTRQRDGLRGGAGAGLTRGAAACQSGVPRCPALDVVQIMSRGGARRRTPRRPGAGSAAAGRAPAAVSRAAAARCRRRRGAARPAATAQRGDQRVLVDDAAAGGVEHVRRAEPAERRGVEQPRRSRASGGSAARRRRTGEQLLEAASSRRRAGRRNSTACRSRRRRAWATRRPMAP
jgi:hypothetical protein